jgi:hypothetical protein
MIRPRLLSLPLVIVLLASMARAEPATQPAGQRVFVAGPSFHVPIAAILPQIAKGAGVDQTIAGQQMIGGSSVTQHWNLPDDKNKAKAALKTGKVDVLTVSPNILLPDEAIDKFTDLLLENNPNGRVTVQASWVPRDGALLGFSNAKRDTTDLAALKTLSAPFTDKVRAQVKAINEAHAAKFNRPVAFVVPVGDAVVRLRERVAKGEVPGIEKQSALFRDDLGHGKEAIYLLNAYCHYAVIYRRSPVGLPVPDALTKAGLGENTAKVNAILQEIAWSVVTEEPASGVKAAAAAADSGAKVEGASGGGGK